VGHAGAISEALVFSKSAELLYARGYLSGIRPSAPPYHGEAKEARTEQSNRCWFRHRGREFGDHDLAVAGVEISHQDLIDARIERAAAPARSITAFCGAGAATAAAISTSPTRAAAGRLWVPATSAPEATRSGAKAAKETRKRTPAPGE
jgi:hypothetical protein